MLCEQGLTTEQISKELGLAKSTINEYKRAAQGGPNKNQLAQARAERCTEAVRLHGEGMTIEGIANNLGVSVYTIKRYLQEAQRTSPAVSPRLMDSLQGFGRARFAAAYQMLIDAGYMEAD
jgi:DNA-binding NarL/FixJ family response regulator